VAVSDGKLTVRLPSPAIDYCLLGRKNRHALWHVVSRTDRTDVRAAGDIPVSPSRCSPE